MRTITIIAILAICVCSCKRRKPDTTALANSFADIECRAILLREQRFALANKIRFTEDTLLHATSANKTRLAHALETMHDQKTRITAQSLALADTIKSELDNVINGGNLTAAEKNAFAVKLNALLERKFYIKNTITTPLQ